MVMVIDFWIFQVSEAVLQVKRVELRVALGQLMHIIRGGVDDIGPGNGFLSQDGGCH